MHADVLASWDFFGKLASARPPRLQPCVDEALHVVVHRQKIDLAQATRHAEKQDEPGGFARSRVRVHADVLASWDFFGKLASARPPRLQPCVDEALHVVVHRQKIDLAQATRHAEKQDEPGGFARSRVRAARFFSGAYPHILCRCPWGGAARHIL